MDKHKYIELRNLAISVTAEQLHLDLDATQTIIYGVIMDWNNENTIITVVGFKTGDSSIYIKYDSENEKILIGGFAHKNVRESAKSFVKCGHRYLYRASLTQNKSLPEKNHIKFHLLTNQGLYVVSEKMENIENNKTDLIEFFNLGNVLISEFHIAISNNK